METKTHISIKDLTIWYGNQQALNNISIDIPDKKITAIIGPSGCGKSTFLKSLNRLIDLQDGVKLNGEILVDEENILDPKIEVTHLRKKMGLLSQRPQVLPLSIYENVAYGPRIHGVKNKKRLDETVEYYLKEANLWNEVKDRLHSPAGKLSIGQQQRLCLSRGLAVEPEIILGDEPTSALDPMSSQVVEELFLKLKNKYTIVLVTHSLAQAKRVADYVIFLYLGNLIEHGYAYEILKNPRYSKTQAYINGKLIEEHKIERELNLKGVIGFSNFVKTKLVLEGLQGGQILRVIIDDKNVLNEIPQGIEFEGHKVLELKRLTKTDWEIIIQKLEMDYTV